MKDPETKRTIFSNEELVRSLGADEFINYETTSLAASGQQVDVALLAVLEEKPGSMASLLKPGGIVVSVVPGYNPSAQGIRAKSVFVHPSTADLDTITSFINQGLVKTVVSHIFPLSEAQQVHKIMEKSHASGKIALQV